MLFSYLNLPSLPLEYEEACLSNINLIDNDPILNHLNTKEGIGHNITYIPATVKQWLLKNVLTPYFSPVPNEMITKTMLHVSHYIKHQEGTGVHPTHIDYGRKYAINYIIDTGGDNVITYWTKDDKSTILKEVVIESHRWHILHVNPVWHGVKGIKLGRLRSIISICFNPTDMENFDANEYFRVLL